MGILRLVWYHKLYDEYQEKGEWDENQVEAIFNLFVSIYKILSLLLNCLIK